MDRVRIEYPSFGTIEIDGERFDCDVVIDGGSVRTRDKEPSRRLKGSTGHTPLSADEAIPWTAPTLVIGTGYSSRLPVMDDVRRAAAEHDVTLIELPTADACELLRSLEPSQANAILHVTC